MVYTSSERHEQLAQWLYRLVAILQTQGGVTWRLFVLAVSGKSAVIDLDGTQLRLRAEAGDPLQVHIESIREPHAVDFWSDGETLRDVINGNLTLDAAVTSGQINVRGTLQDLLNIQQVVMGILADSAINPEFQRLWDEFNQSWLSSRLPPSCRSLDQQLPQYGYLITHVPDDVLRIDVD